MLSLSFLTAFTIAAVPGKVWQVGEKSVLTICSLKNSNVPELLSLPYNCILASAPPTSFQLVIFPEKISPNCFIVSSETAFSLLRKTDKPSLAQGISTPIVPYFSFIFPTSEDLIGRLELAISVEPLINAAKPTPDPPPVTWIAVPGFFFIYTSAHF